MTFFRFLITFFSWRILWCWSGRRTRLWFLGRAGFPILEIIVITIVITIVIIIVIVPRHYNDHQNFLTNFPSAFSSHQPLWVLHSWPVRSSFTSSGIAALPRRLYWCFARSLWNLRNFFFFKVCGALTKQGTSPFSVFLEVTVSSFHSTLPHLEGRRKWVLWGAVAADTLRNGTRYFEGQFVMPPLQVSNLKVPTCTTPPSTGSHPPPGQI